MRVRCTSSNRELTLHVLQNELGQPVRYSGSPAFSCTVGDYTLLRSGWISCDVHSAHADSDQGQQDLRRDSFTKEQGGTRCHLTVPEYHPVFEQLAFLGLCDYPIRVQEIDGNDISFPMSDFSGTDLLNLFRMLSARYVLLNRALDVRGAFFVEGKCMRHVEKHPPESVDEFLQALYDWKGRYRGVSFSRTHVVLSGFRKGKAEERQIHQQLADLMVNAARSRTWTKSFSRNAKNKKYIFRTWLNSIGMIGPEYEHARSVLLSRLPGRTDRRTI